MKYAQGGITGKTGQNVKVEVPVAGKASAPPAKESSGGGSPPPAKKGDAKRLRVSCWVGHPAEVYGRWIDITTGKFQEDKSNLQKSKGALDDISCIGGLKYSADGKVELQSFYSPYMNKATQYAHANGIQVTIGFSIADEGSSTGTRSKKFCDWMSNPTSPTLEQWADAMLSLVFDKEKFDVDGIGFDIELNGLKALHADNFVKLYGYLADKLAGMNKWLHVATGIGEHASETGCLGTFQAQPFRLAKGHSNVIIRPMAYDMFNLDDGRFLQWHKDIVDYAVNKVGLDPGQFQLGLKTGKNVKVKGYDPGPTWSPTKCTFDSNGIADRAKTVCKPANVGVCTFAGYIDFKTVDAALNGGGTPAGTAGSPLQVPLAAALGG